jgi:hypothetical protein
MQPSCDDLTLRANSPLHFFPLTGLIQVLVNSSMDCCLLGKVFIHNAAFGLLFFLFVPEITLNQLTRYKPNFSYSIIMLILSSR